MQRLTPELLTLVASYVYDAGTTEDLRSTALLSCSCKNFRNAALPLMFSTLSPSHMHSHTLLRTLLKQPDLGDRVVKITAMLGPVQFDGATCTIATTRGDQSVPSASELAATAMAILS